MGRVKFKFEVNLYWYPPESEVPGVQYDPLEQHVEEVEADDVRQAWREIYVLIWERMGPAIKRLKELDVRYKGAEEVAQWQGDQKITWAQKIARLFAKLRGCSVQPKTV